ncbi:MAG: hypothetical protein ACD_65C00125G0005 [uncultured bacterium]|nr:MAG: hypothetical protein ACD_65C00125G0005 [uncultured bacterium]
MIPAKISTETPFDMPFSVINSPIHISIIVPAVTVSIIGRITEGSDILSIIGVDDCELMRRIIP